MPETRSHRGPHPNDRWLFAAQQHTRLRQAVADLSWLLGRGYAQPSALKLVGDRYQLAKRQRLAVMRSSCSDQARQARARRQVDPEAAVDRPVVIDGFNLITTIEAALAGGVLLRGRDGCVRDMASMHGSYRKVAETSTAIDHIGRTLAVIGVGEVRWYLDRPVSNSGRLKRWLDDAAAEADRPWQVRLADSPDRCLIESDHIVVSADSAILDRCGPWLNLASHVLAERLPAICVIDLQ